MRSARPSGPVLRHLREATGTLHEALDASADGQAILAGQITRPAYIRMLTAHLALHQYVAGYVSRLLALKPSIVLLDWPQCDRLVALHADVVAMGTQPDAAAPFDIPPTTPSAAFACGLLYVVEGACHGTGKMLHALKKNHEFVTWKADAFMTASRDHIATRWPHTVALLEQHGLSRLEATTQGAVAGFQCYAEAQAGALAEV